MRVKRYVVNDLPEALPLIKSELGSDAVILNTKEIYIGGFLGMFRKKKMEVIAAIETNAQQTRQPAQPRAAQGAGVARPRPAAQLPSEAASPLIFTASPAAASIHHAPPAAEDKSRLSEPPLPQETQTVQASPPVPASVAAVMDRKLAPPSAAAVAVEQTAVLDEIKQMKELMRKLAGTQLAQPETAALAALRERLAGQEVAAAWIERLIEAVKEHPGYLEDEGAEGVWRIASELLREWMKDFEAPGISPDKRIVHVVGPTGVGKTTTIAKLAAEQSLKAKRKVGFITSDTYRIAAVDQLRTYANILNVPLEVVFSPLELARAFKALDDRDMIFMDTAGRNFRNELFVSEVNSLLSQSANSDTYLVLSLTAKTKDMEAVASRFLQYGIDKLIFTKFDETDTLGAILNLAMEHRLRTAYMTYGQNVPDDIEPFQSDLYVKQLLGAASHE